MRSDPDPALKDKVDKMMESVPLED